MGTQICRCKKTAEIISNQESNLSHEKIILKLFQIPYKSDVELFEPISLEKVQQKNLIIKLQKTIKDYLAKIKLETEGSVKIKKKMKAQGYGVPPLKLHYKLSKQKHSIYSMFDIELDNANHYQILDLFELSNTRIKSRISEGDSMVSTIDEPKGLNGVKLIMLKDGNQLYSCFKDGKANGYGQLMMNNSNTYLGSFVNNKKCGFGMFIASKSKELCFGEWIDDSRNGIGIESYEDGSSYEGEILNGKKHGIGTYRTQDQWMYQGEWSEDYFDGLGIYFFDPQQNKCFVGHFKRNRLHGYGEYYHPRMRYIGFYLNGKQDGFGISYWENEKRIFVGFWKNGKHEGLSRTISEDSKSKMDYWIDNEKTEYVYSSELEALTRLKEDQMKYKAFFIMSVNSLVSFFNGNS